MASWHYSRRRFHRDGLFYCTKTVLQVYNRSIMSFRLVFIVVAATSIFAGVPQTVLAYEDGPTLAPTMDIMCRDNPNHDCEWLASDDKCDWTSNNLVVGDYYCPVSCDRCPSGSTISANQVSVDKTCYNYGESIVASFANMDPRRDDWIGIYSVSAAEDGTSNMILMAEEPLLWLYLCGEQDDMCKVSYGMLTFGSEAPVVTGESTFPLDAGVYFALLLRDGWPPYSAFVASDSFEIKAAGEYCSHGPTPPSSYPAPHPPTSAYGTPAPVPPPTPAPRESYPAPSTLAPHPVGYPTPTLASVPPSPSPYPPPHSPNDYSTTPPAPHVVYPTPNTPAPHPVGYPTPTPAPQHLVDYPTPGDMPHPGPTATPAPAPTPCMDNVTTDKTCYNRATGEDVVLIFENCDPQPFNWVGVYDAQDDPTTLGSPVYWVWLCGSTTCTTTSDAHGNITISNSLLVVDGVKGDYRAHLVASASPVGAHYSAYASSATFRVQINEC